MPIDPKILILLYIVAIVLFMKWSSSRKKKKEKERMESLKEGIEILTIGGIRGTIVKIDDQYVDVKVAKGVIMTFRKTAISAPISPEKIVESSETK